MPKITVNLVDVKLLEAIPEGSYRARVSKTEEALSKASGQPMISWEFEVVEGEYKGRKLFSNTSLKENALFRLKELVEAIKVRYDRSGFEIAECLGRELILTVETELYEGKLQNRITAYGHI